MRIRNLVGYIFVVLHVGYPDKVWACRFILSFKNPVNLYYLSVRRGLLRISITLTPLFSHVRVVAMDFVRIVQENNEVEIPLPFKLF
jgi:hypothetical protein